MKNFIFGKTEFKLLHTIHSVIPDDIQGHTHSKNSFELHYIEKGRGTLDTHTNSYELYEGTFFVTGPEVWHKQLTDKSDPLVEYCLYFQCEEKPKDLISQIFTEQAFFIGRNNDKLKYAFEQTAKYIISTNIFDLQEQVIFVQLIMNELSRLYAPEIINSEKFTPEDRKNIIIEDSFLYDYKDITLSALAQRLGMSERQTQRLIKKYYGKTFAVKKTEARLEKAKILIDKNMKISDIATAVGYADSSSFIKAYKNKYGISPKKQ